MLGHYFGPTYAYTDSTEKEFGLLPRRFTSFKQAADEAAISRLYGGIHFRDAIRQGQVLGQQVGALVVRRLGSPTGARLAASSAAQQIFFPILLFQYPCRVHAKELSQPHS